VTAEAPVVTPLRFRSAKLYASEADLGVDGLRLSFDVTRTLAIEPNKGAIQVWNLSESSRTKVQTISPLFVSLLAGYSSNVSKIFEGDVSRVWTERDGPDLITKFEAGDAELAYQTARIADSFGSEQKFENVFTRVVRALVRDTRISGKAAIKKLESGDFKAAGKRFARGFVTAGRTLDELARLAQSGALEVSVQNGELQVLDVGETIEGVTVEVSPDLGLLGVPTVMQNGLVAMKTLLIPDIQPGRLVRLRSSALTSLLRMERGRWSGDTRSGSWTIDGEYSIREGFV